MPLALFTSTFAQDLINAESPGAKTPEESAKRFGDAFIKYFENATVNGVYPAEGTTKLPNAVSALYAGLTSAFKATGGANAVCSLMEAAFFAYWNATPFITMFPAANAIAPTVPLKTYMSSISAPDPSQPSAKNKVAKAMELWMTQGPLITLNPVPPGTTVYFI